MRRVTIASHTDFDGWRTAARALCAGGTAPEDIDWGVAGEGGLFDDAAMGRPDAAPVGSPEGRPVTASRSFVELAERVICHRDPARLDLLYRLLWRLQANGRLLDDATDPDVAAAMALGKAVNRASHKMKAFVRFRRVGEGEDEVFVAWFEPAHRVVALTAPFFVRRFTGMRFSILTPDGCAHWDGTALALGPGVSRDQAPGEDVLEDLWRDYYAAIFNPARLKVKAMQAEMPKRYWRNLPEARLIPDLIAAAEQRTDDMVAREPSPPPAYAARAVRAPVVRAAGDAPLTSLSGLKERVDGCRRCPLWRDATQGVAGEGPQGARLMLVGEQPGDQEDLAGRPFIGPAGQMLERALAEAGVDRAAVYITNAVKHFRHELRGKRRLHQTPSPAHVSTCRWWLEEERRLVRPAVILALGATAALSVFGKAMPIGASRGRAHPLEGEARGLVSYHPSYLLRVPDERARREGLAALVEDLALAARLAA
jgi:DNA polymerase